MRVFQRALAVSAAAAALITGSLTSATAAPVRSGTADAALLGDVYHLVNRGTGRCLDAFYSGGGENGNAVGLWDCNGGISEQWRLISSHDLLYPYALVNERKGRCLDYPAESDGRIGWQFKLWDCNQSASQNLKLVPFGNYYKIYMQRNGTAPMDAYASSGGLNGNPVGIWSETGSPLQHWTLQPY
ncbi:RICIN domain-containing protein [Streptomyces sp. MA5143a]|uniref:RICIN domain-containing protein n=1 Tax=Streptomyces sp. MA5143a TaxID=2083010 RepID=UPI000D1AEC26|nr:RICIN domain-containing protein [Streptomyces sp. MA5143a]SPE99800.1 Glucan endo-1,3-beta-glucosidase precursor [Streptomyces sp. MA5143a]